MGEVPLLLLRLRLRLWLLWLRKLSQHWRVCHVCASQVGAACFGCCASLGLPVGCAECVRDPAVKREWVNACMKSLSSSSSETPLCLPLSLFGDQFWVDSSMELSSRQAWGLKHTTGWLQLRLHRLVCPCGALVWPRLLNNVIESSFVR